MIMQKIPSSEITPEHIYLNRRQFMKTAGVAASAALLAACGVKTSPETPTSDASGSAAEPMEEGAEVAGQEMTDELGDAANSFEEITNYNNYYEFTFDKEGVAPLAEDYPTSPWEVEVGGLVNNPTTFTMEDILSQFDQEERIYRLRCVEGWSMVIPWEGFALSKLLDVVEPTSAAQFVQFQTVLDPENMPGQNSGWYSWPYIEGLRLDEAMNDLTLLATGLYGKQLLPQNGAPIRLVVPWKYGFKSAKSIVRIDLVDAMPENFWKIANPREYGFYANVNPEVPHPRWSQASERRIGELGRRPTLMFNGYEEEVAYLYEGMNLRANF
ncbi:MAG: protein-methionine-sulfoxide reductase catalytic subunit MsrP [Anaerolineales bacterium]|nr:protein-methionine-sulfoxide reductase catalytic subunit MsrP [Anaerolineales bacterium]